MFSAACDIEFVRFLCRTNGEAFGTGLLGSAPSTVLIGAGIGRAKLVDLFVALFNHAGAWDSQEENFPECFPRRQQKLSLEEEALFERTFTTPKIRWLAQNSYQWATVLAEHRRKVQPEIEAQKERRVIQKWLREVCL